MLFGFAKMETWSEYLMQCLYDPVRLQTKADFRTSETKAFTVLSVDNATSRTAFRYGTLQ